MKIVLAVAVLAASVTFVALDSGPRDQTKQTAAKPAVQTVEVITLLPAPQQDMITAFGQVRPRWQVSLQSEVSGRVLQVADAALQGATVGKGDVLARIEDTAQKLALAERETDLAAAQQQLAEERQRAQIAAENWQAAGYSQPPGPLVLRKPQLAVAESQLTSARLAVERTRYVLDQTHITAPFDGVVIRRSVSPGDLVQAGSEVVLLYDASQLDVVLSLTEAEIARLDDRPGAKVRLISQRSGQVWSAQIERFGREVEASNRWVDVLVAVSAPEGILPGQFLRAEISGQEHPSAFAVPQALVARDDAIWHVDSSSVLRRLAVTPLFAHDDIVFVASHPNLPQTLRLTPPRTSFLDGQRVVPSEKGPVDAISLASKAVGQ